MNESSQIHLAIIPDGNRRWSAKQVLKTWQGHEQGAKVADTIVRWAYKNSDVSTLTLWGLSTENWSRSKPEINKLMKIYYEWLMKKEPELIEQEIRFLHSGRLDRLPKKLVDKINEASEVTSGFRKFTLHIALDYGGQDEIIRAFNKARQAGKLTPESFRQYLDQPDLPDIDLLMRTSGEQRLSNFMLWQLAYTELYFADKHFPELTSEDLDQAVAEFRNRQRRFGK